MASSKFYLLFICGLMLLFSSCASHRFYESCSQLTNINIIDRDGISETISNPERVKRYRDINFLCNQPYQKVLRVYSMNREGNILAYVTCYHPNGQIKQYLEVVNGRAFGVFREWYSDGIMKVEACVVGGDADITTASEKTWLFDGCNQAWDEQGRLSAAILYEKGVLQGESLYYHTNGNVWKKVPFEKNEVNGTYEVFLEDGRLLLSSEYKNGQRHGCTTRYWGDGSISSDETFCDGRLIEGHYYDLCGNEVARIDQGNGERAIFGKNSLIELHEYRDGILEGEIKIFGRYHNLFRVFHIKNGLKHGEEIEYYEKPVKGQALQPKLLVSWYDSKIQGVCKTWYDNGMLESQREMSNNAKNGMLTAWYRDGNLMLIEDYERNKLMRGEYYKKGEKTPISTISFGKGIATLYGSEGHFMRKVSYLNGAPVE